ncbi:hypothetical protein AUJ42_01830 [Candidatus Collierbacteria bacterium CG1_02_44_10]|uniref:Uncharacterized protein n=1 Tax=Candidatus Collierbacteria bacterium CG1_02_44_10 TaxID=1805087 RepID=A0A1J4RWP0_9BACT|nr:MAG: hypothetical protein AUJ42_01830 [Candidatus Collierbacteria bacterium CG1_02_44_10]
METTIQLVQHSSVVLVSSQKFFLTEKYQAFDSSGDTLDFERLLSQPSDNFPKEHGLRCS